jgi:hypothetical protein
MAFRPKEGFMVERQWCYYHPSRRTNYFNLTITNFIAAPVIDEDFPIDDPDHCLAAVQAMIKTYFDRVPIEVAVDYLEAYSKTTSRYIFMYDCYPKQEDGLWGLYDTYYSRWAVTPSRPSFKDAVMAAVEANILEEVYVRGAAAEWAYREFEAYHPELVEIVKKAFEDYKAGASCGDYDQPESFYFHD